MYDESDMKRSMLASHKERSRGKQDADINKMNYANALYRSHNGGLDPEFARAKAINFGLKKLGTNIKEQKAGVMSRQIAPIVPPSIATAEAESEEVYTQIEEVSTQINETVNVKNIEL